MDAFPLGGLLRRIRRTADCSQRELAHRIGASKTALAGAEDGTRDLRVGMLARAAAVVGWRLTVLDAEGAEVVPMHPDTVRDGAARLFPAHLDTRHGDEDWWGTEHRPRLRPPRYTFDRDRERRDGRRSAAGAPEDHHVPQPGDSLADRAEARQRAAEDRWRERRRRSVDEVPPSGPDWAPAAPAAPSASTTRSATRTCNTLRPARAGATSPEPLLP